MTTTLERAAQIDADARTDQPWCLPSPDDDCWLPVPGWPEYSINPAGDVRSEPRVVDRSDGKPYPVRPRIMRQSTHPISGLRSVLLARPGVRQRIHPHKVAAAVFAAIPDHPADAPGGSVTFFDVDGMFAILGRVFAGGMPSFPDAECRKVDPRIMDSVDAPIDGLRACARCVELTACQEWLAGLKRNHVSGIVAGRVIHHRQ